MQHSLFLLLLFQHTMIIIWDRYVYENLQIACIKRSLCAEYAPEVYNCIWKNFLFLLSPPYTAHRECLLEHMTAWKKSPRCTAMDINNIYCNVSVKGFYLRIELIKFWFCILLLSYSDNLLLRCLIDFYKNLLETNIIVWFYFMRFDRFLITQQSIDCESDYVENSM